MKSKTSELLLLPEFKKFIAATATGRRYMASGKRMREGTIEQYQSVLTLLTAYEALQVSPVRIVLLNRAGQRLIWKEKKYWMRFYRQFGQFMYHNRNCYDRYVSAVFKVIKAFFNFLLLDKALPVGEFHKRFRIPEDKSSPVILSPMQLKFLIVDETFEVSLPANLQRIKDIFVFGCTVALRYQDLMGLRKTNIQVTGADVFMVLHTQKTGAAVRVPLPYYAQAIIKKYNKKAGRFILPRLSCSNLNLGIKQLIKKAGWDEYVPKIRTRRGEPVEIKNAAGKTLRFYEHITAHTMRRTAITTLLLLGVDENSVRAISGHAPGSKEFYRYVGLVQEFLNVRVKEAHKKLLEEPGPGLNLAE